MNFTKLKNRIHNQIVINKRLKVVCLWYLLFLMISVRKHSLSAAAQFSGLATSQFSRFLQNHTDVAVYNLNQLIEKAGQTIIGADQLSGKASTAMAGCHYNRQHHRAAF